MKIVTLIIFVLLFIQPASAIMTPDEYRLMQDPILLPNKEDYVCVDYAVIYAREHPGFNCVAVSCAGDFRTNPHCLCYNITETEIIFVDPTWNCEITFPINTSRENITIPYNELYPNHRWSKEWSNYTYFRFFGSEAQIVRNFIQMRDNFDEYVN